MNNKLDSMDNSSLPSITIIMPTLNSAKTIKSSIDSIVSQDYPKNKFEIIIADADSSDNTIKIVEEVCGKNNIKHKIVENKLKTGEAGKAQGYKYAINEICAFIDSDNILPTNNWLRSLIEPFQNSDIIASEPIEYTYRQIDGYITRYSALLGMNDPVCLFLGNYDRICTLTGKWTEVPHKLEDKGNYFKIELDKKKLPTIGANGFFVRKSLLNECQIGNYLFDIDVIYELLNRPGVGENLRIAKVKTGIIHLFSGNMSTFARKQKRRIRDYLYYNNLGIRSYPWEQTSNLKLLKFIFYCITFIPLVIQALIGYFKKADYAWFFHPVACEITLWQYAWGKIFGLFGVKELKRKNWKQ